MKYILFFIVVSLYALAGNAQEQKTKPDINGIKSEMILRSNTRDKVTITKNNIRRQQTYRRKQMLINKQRRIQQQRMNQIKRHRIMRQRMIQQRKIRQQAIRRHQRIRR
jgi:hypothetical protein